MPIFPCKALASATTTLPRQTQAPNGFSLLEVLVTLAIISVIVSVTTVSLSSNLEGARFSSEAKAAVAQIRNYRARALLMGQSTVVVTDTSEEPSEFINNVWRLALPEGWHTEGQAIGITASGMCLGGRVMIVGPTGRRATYTFSPPDCIPKRAVITASRLETGAP